MHLFPLEICFIIEALVSIDLIPPVNTPSNEALPTSELAIAGSLKSTSKKMNVIPIIKESAPSISNLTEESSLATSITNAATVALKKIINRIINLLSNLAEEPSKNHPATSFGAL